MANMIFSEKSPIISLCQYGIYLFNLRETCIPLYVDHIDKLNV